MSSKITVRNLRKSFQSRNGRIEALADVNLTVDRGEFLCIVGPSGCGKSTFLRIMADLETYTSGTIEIEHEDASRPLTSMVFQDHALFPWMTVLENAEFGLAMQGMTESKRRELVMPWLDIVGLTDFQRYFPNQLSGGMRQRVSLVRAFVTNPEVLLMDEPFAALDAQNKILLQDELVRIWERSRQTVVYITHSIDEALFLGDRVIVMTSAPGQLKDVLQVAFERPRDIFEIRSKPEFATMSQSIWQSLKAEVKRTPVLVS